MLVTYDLPDHLVDRFRTALNFTHDREQDVVQRFILAYIQQAFAQELESLTHYAPSAAEHAVLSFAHTGANGDCAKALRRLPSWAGRPTQINHQIIRAFFACEHNGVASRDRMRQFFLQQANRSRIQFDYNFSNMCTESGNSHGKVFDCVDDRVSLSAPVEPLARQLRSQFYAGN